MRCMRRADASLVYELFSPLSEFGQLEVRYNQFTIYAAENWIKRVANQILLQQLVTRSDSVCAADSSLHLQTLIAVCVCLLYTSDAADE